jgi:hypothetical protein
VSLPAGTTATTATSTPCDNVQPHSGHVLAVVGTSGISSGAVQLQGSNDNSTWTNIGTPLNAVASSTVQQSAYGVSYRYVTAIVSTAVVGGTITALVGSFS